ncbi:MAG TPA: TetR family transcriptional regulator, partial [Polyangiales bacterium]
MRARRAPAARARRATRAVETRDRLIEVALELFAERGFRNVTVRDISQRAHANLAAISYHFGDKLGLYTEI